MARTTLIALLILLAALVAGTALRAAAIADKQNIMYDDTITYLAATGHMGEYEESAARDLRGRWVPAADWQAMTQEVEPFAFVTIGADLARRDMHPPLYFWLLNVWSSVFGVGMRTGPALNALIAIVTGACLFGLARQVLKDPVEAAIVVFAWAVSSPVILISLMARHYELLATVTVLFVWLAMRDSDLEVKLRRRDLVFLTAAVAAGCLTHYHFALALTGGAVFAAVRLWRRDRRRLAQLGTAALVGVGVFAILQPLFYLSLALQRDMQATRASVHEMYVRGHHLFWSLASFFVDHDTVISLFKPMGALTGGALRPWVPVALVALAAVVVALAWPRSRRGLAGALKRTDRRGFAILFFLAWIGGLTALLFLVGQSPPWAYQARYLAAVWPFLAFLPVLVCRVFGRWSKVIAAVFCVAVILPGGVGRVLTSRSHAPTFPPTMAAAPGAIIDSTLRGVVPRIVWTMPGGTPVFAARPDDLVADPQAWQRELVAGDLYVNVPASGPDGAAQAELRKVLEERYELTPVPTTGTTFKVYRLEPRGMSRGM